MQRGWYKSKVGIKVQGIICLNKGRERFNYCFRENFFGFFSLLERV